MKQASKKSADVVGALITERVKFEQWIAALEAKKASTPPNVYARVHGDYVARLEAVMAELGARSAELESQRDTLKSRSEDLASQENLLREERAEADLRNTVGEYTPDQWKELVRTSDERIAKVSSERVLIDGELAGLERILSGTSGSAASASSDASPHPQNAPATPPAASSTASGEGERTGEKPAVKPPVSPPPPRPSFDELAFISSVVPEGSAKKEQRKPSPSQPDLGIVGQGSTPTRSTTAATPSAQAPAAPKPEAPRRATPAATAAPVPASPPVSSAIIPPPEKPAPPSTNAAAGPAEPKVAMKPELLQQRPAPPQLRSSRQVNASELDGLGIENLSEDSVTRSETPTFLKNVPTEQAKALKCGECGALNYATEWYCERCGAELSAM